MQCVADLDMVWGRFLVLPADTKSKVTSTEVNVIVEKLPARPLKHRAKVVHLLAPVCVLQLSERTHFDYRSVYGFSVSCTSSFFLRY